MANQSPYYVLGYPCEFRPTTATPYVQDHRSYYTHPQGALSHFGTETFRFGMAAGEQEARYGKQVIPAPKMINSIKQEAKKEDNPWPGSASTRIPPEWIPDQRRSLPASSSVKKEDSLPEKNNGSKTKPKRVRTAFTPFQLLCLETSFERNHYVVGGERKQLATYLKLSETQVKVWFQNRRTKWKRMTLENRFEELNKDPLTP